MLIPHMKYIEIPPDLHIKETTKSNV